MYHLGEHHRAAPGLGAHRGCEGGDGAGERVLLGRGGHRSNAAPLKAGYLVHIHPQLPHISLVEVVTQPPYTLLEGGATGNGLCFPLQE